MRVIEKENPQLAGVLPKTYQIFNAKLLKSLLKTFSTIPIDLEGDSFGKRRPPLRCTTRRAIACTIAPWSNKACSWC
jgi:hypothetical protein